MNKETIEEIIELLLSFRKHTGIRLFMRLLILWNEKGDF